MQTTMGSQSTSYFTDIHGIKFFNSPAECISHYDRNDLCTKIVSFANVVFSIITFTFIKIFRFAKVFIFGDPEMRSLEVVNPQVAQRKRLVVCLHGLNHSPAQFKDIYNEMKKRDLSDTTVFAPRILSSGNAPLDEMISDIIEKMQPWFEQREKNTTELVLIGISNGGRLIRALEAQLIKLGHCENIQKLRTVSIVGATYGSDTVNLANRIGLSSILPKPISVEMPTDSPRNVQLKKDWEDAIGNSTHIDRECVFLASPHDHLVPNTSSTLATVVAGIKARYAIAMGESHTSVIFSSVVSRAVAQIVFE